MVLTAEWVGSSVMHLLITLIYVLLVDLFLKSCQLKGGTNCCWKKREQNSTMSKHARLKIHVVRLRLLPGTQEIDCRFSETMLKGVR